MTGSNYLTVAYDQRTGAKLWARRTSGGTDELHAIAVSPSGSMLYVTGTREMPVTDEDVFTIAYDAATGTTRWSARYNQSRGGESLEDFGDAIAVSPDGSKVFVAGSSGGPFALLVAYNAETGARLWARSLQRSSWFFALAASPDSSRVYTTGGVDTPTQFSNDLTMAFNASNGSTLWSRQYNGPAGGEDGGNLIAVSPDGSRLYVSGASSKLGEPGWTAGFLDWATIAYRANTGTRLWAKRYESGVPLSIAVAPAGDNVYVYGSSDQPGSAVVAYAASSGAIRWIARSTMGWGRAALSPDGTNLYVTRRSVAGYVTTAYSESGGLLWTTRALAISEETIAVGVSPDGHEVFVTGSVFVAGSTSPFQILTAAYAG